MATGAECITVTMPMQSAFVTAFDARMIQTSVTAYFAARYSGLPATAAWTIQAGVSLFALWAGITALRRGIRAPGALAIVHWQQAEPPTPGQLQDYLAGTWDLKAETLNLEPSSEPWFRNGGHQTRFRLPQPPTWQQQSLLTLRE